MVVVFFVLTKVMLAVSPCAVLVYSEGGGKTGAKPASVCSGRTGGSKLMVDGEAVVDFFTVDDGKGCKNNNFKLYMYKY